MYACVNKKGRQISTDVSLHPGEIIMMELDARDIKKSVFAAQLGIKPGHLSELLHGRRHVSTATAIKLEQLLDMPADYWMRVQVYHDLFVERNKSSEAA